MDFIQENKTQSDKNVELICRAIMSHMGDNIYDGCNPFAPKVCVCYDKGNDDYYWGETCDTNKLFVPSRQELETAMREFKKKGYFPCYDYDVCFYKVHKDKSEVRGEYAIKHTTWL